MLNSEAKQNNNKKNFFEEFKENPLQALKRPLMISSVCIYSIAAICCVGASIDLFASHDDANSINTAIASAVLLIAAVASGLVAHLSRPRLKVNKPEVSNANKQIQSTIKP